MNILGSLDTNTPVKQAGSRLKFWGKSSQSHKHAVIASPVLSSESPAGPAANVSAHRDLARPNAAAAHNAAAMAVETNSKVAVHVGGSKIEVLPMGGDKALAAMQLQHKRYQITDAQFADLKSKLFAGDEAVLAKYLTPVLPDKMPVTAELISDDAASTAQPAEKTVSADAATATATAKEATVPTYSSTGPDGYCGLPPADAPSPQPKVLPPPVPAAALPQQFDIFGNSVPSAVVVAATAPPPIPAAVRANVTAATGNNPFRQPRTTQPELPLKKISSSPDSARWAAIAANASSAAAPTDTQVSSAPPSSAAAKQINAVPADPWQGAKSKQIKHTLKAGYRLQAEVVENTENLMFALTPTKEQLKSQQIGANLAVGTGSSSSPAASSFVKVCTPTIFSLVCICVSILFSFLACGGCCVSCVYNRKHRLTRNGCSKSVSGQSVHLDHFPTG